MSKKKGLPTAPACNGLLPEEEQDIRKEVASVVADPRRWLDAPNDQLGGRKPKDLIGTEQEQHVRDLLRAIKHGMPT
jgi:uncharacterized protein (DUF2384 family)